MSGSTISNNSARFSGGGVLINARGNYPFVQIRNSTLSGNSAPDFGSAVSVFSVDGGWGVGWLINSTVTDSTSFGGAVHSWAFGEYSGAEYVLTNSIVANQSSGADCSTFSPDAYAGSFDDGSNIDSDYSCHLVAPSSQPGVDPLVGPLQDNGGPTLTHGIASVASPALDWIGLGCGPGEFVEVDQRGVERPQGAQCDVGAFELDPYSALLLLYDGVDGLVGGGFLNGGQGNALTSKLDAAWADLEKGKANAAAGVLGAFINQLEDFLDEGLLTPEQAEALIATAEWVLGAIATP
jgi:hypothetical protein